MLHFQGPRFPENQKVDGENPSSHPLWGKILDQRTDERDEDDPGYPSDQHCGSKRASRRLSRRSLLLVSFVLTQSHCYG